MLQGQITTLQNQLNAIDLSQIDANIASLNAALAVAEVRIDDLENLLVHFSRVGNNVHITGANLHIENGLGSTATTNRLGNLIIGYNELRPRGGDNRSGSHMLVLGQESNYSSYGGFVGGFRNSTNAGFASVIAGVVNNANGLYSSITAGIGNSTSGDYSSVTGGSINVARSSGAVVVGGVNNFADGSVSVVSGGNGNRALAHSSSVSGGLNNQATGLGASVSGGFKNGATGRHSSVSGGTGQVATGLNEHLP